MIQSQNKLFRILWDACPYSLASLPKFKHKSKCTLSYAVLSSKQKGTVCPIVLKSPPKRPLLSFCPLLWSEYLTACLLCTCSHSDFLLPRLPPCYPVQQHQQLWRYHQITKDWLCSLLSWKTDDPVLFLVIWIDSFCCLLMSLDQLDLHRVEIQGVLPWQKFPITRMTSQGRQTHTTRLRFPLWSLWSRY